MAERSAGGKGVRGTRTTGAGLRTPAARAASASSTGARARLHESARRVSEAYEQLAIAAREAGPLDSTAVALAKVALSIGQGSSRGAHAHARKALEAGVSPAELRHLVALALPTLGLAATLDALRWIDETIKEQRAGARG